MEIAKDVCLWVLVCAQIAGSGILGGVDFRESCTGSFGVSIAIWTFVYCACSNVGVQISSFWVVEV